MNKQEILNTLRNSTAQIEFIKADGTLRVMQATLMEQHIPQAQQDYTSKRKISEDVVAVWDIEKQAWRSFRLDRLVKIQ